MSRLCFMDYETTGLDDERHEPWELGLIVRQEDGDESEHLFRWWPDLIRADPGALRVSRFYDRISPGVLPPWADGYEPDLASVWSTDEAGDFHEHLRSGMPQSQMPMARAAHNVAHYLDGAHVVGAVPDFDTRFLRPWLRRWGHTATHHYHLIDVETLAVGYIHGHAAGVRAAMTSTDAEAGARLRAAVTRAAPATVPSPRAPSLPWSSEDLTRAVGLEPPSDEDRHTALGDVRWARDMWDAVTGGGR